MLIWRQGYNAVSVDTICAAAGANKGSFYHAFPSKADLLVAVIERLWDSQRRQLQTIAAAAAPAGERLRRHMLWYVDMQRNLLADHGFMPGQLDLALDVHVPDAARDRMQQFRAEHRALLYREVEETLIERGATSDRADWLTSVIAHIVMGVISEARLLNSVAPVEELPDIVDRLLDDTAAASRPVGRAARI